MGSVERIKNVAKRVAKWHQAGHQMVVVPSAMSGETNRLLGLAKEISSQPSPRELDMIASTGEQVSVGLLSIALQDIGVEAVSYAGWQVPIKTDSAYTKARIHSIDDERVRRDLDAGKVVIITGFQGVDPDGHITTLGRGGSDTSAVAVAAALEADECLIYTDVDGVYTTDPRVVEEARRLDSVTFEEMLEMASLGSKVLQIRSVEFAGKYRVKTRVLSSLTDPQIPLDEEMRSGTLITFEEDETMEKAVISGIAFQRDEARIAVMGVPDKPGIAYQILGPVADANIDVDMIIPEPERRREDRLHVHGRPRRLPEGDGHPDESGEGPCERRAGAGRSEGVEGVGGRRRDALARRCREHDVPHAVGRGHQHPDDLDVRNQDFGADRREIHGIGGARAAQGIRARSGVMKFP